MRLTRSRRLPRSCRPPRLIGLELSEAQTRLRKLAHRSETIESAAKVEFDVVVQIAGRLPLGADGTRMVVSGYTVDDLPAAEMIGHGARVKLFAVPAATYREDDGSQNELSPLSS